MSRKPKSIPSYFRYSLEDNFLSIPLYPFSFVSSEEGDEYFSISGKVISTSAFRPKRFQENIVGVEKQKIHYGDMVNHPVLVSDEGVILAGPAFHEYLHSPGRIKKTAKTLAEIGIGLCIRHGEDISFSLESSNASLSPVRDGLYIRGVKEKNFAEYQIFDDKSRQDRVSLYAGIGYVAHLAELRLARK